MSNRVFWEGIAVLFEKASLREEFLKNYVEPDAIAKFDDGVKKRLAYRIRRLSYEALFEYSIYLEPGTYEELTKRRADWFRKYFFVEPAIDPPTWTHDIFHITHPCYIQNYVLAEIMAFHLLKGSTGWSVDFSAKIIDKLLVPGGIKMWKDKIVDFSGSPITPDALMKAI